MTTPSQDRVVIIAAVNQTAVSEQVTQTATRLAPSVAGAELHFLYVVDPSTMLRGDSSVPPLSDLLGEARVFVDGLLRNAAARFGGTVAGHIAFGTASKQILQLASDLSADLIVVGSHGKKALERLMQGSVSEAVAKQAHCAVLIARAKEYASVPEIEPPCPKCLDVQGSTHGEKLWCAQHAARHAHGRLHYESSEGFGVGSMFIRP